VIKRPADGGPHFYNYKNTHSVVSLALVGSDYEFLYVNVGCNGQISDGRVFSHSDLSYAMKGRVFSHSDLSYAMKNNLFNFPAVKLLPGQTDIVADDAFPLS